MRHSRPASTGRLFWNPMAHHFLDEDSSTSLKRAGFEQQRASSFVKRVKAPPNHRRGRPSKDGDPSLYATLYTAGGVDELYQRRSNIF